MQRRQSRGLLPSRPHFILWISDGAAQLLSPASDLRFDRGDIEYRGAGGRRAIRDAVGDRAHLPVGAHAKTIGARAARRSAGARHRALYLASSATLPKKRKKNAVRSGLVRIIHRPRDSSSSVLSGTETRRARVSAPSNTLQCRIFQGIDATITPCCTTDVSAYEDLETGRRRACRCLSHREKPTSIYLANRGVKTGNVPLVPACRCHRNSKTLHNPLVVGFSPAETDRADPPEPAFGAKGGSRRRPIVDRQAVAEEVRFSRRALHAAQWDRSTSRGARLEETAAAVIKILPIAAACRRRKTGHGAVACHEAAGASPRAARRAAARC